MHKIIFVSILFIGLLSACKQDNKAGTPQLSKEELLNALAGHWIAVDFCARANQYGSVLSAMNNSHKPYAFSMTFNPAKPDSVVCYNGMETATLPVKFNVDTLEVQGARGPGTSIFMIYNRNETEKDIVAFDRAPSGMQMDRYIKSKAGTPDAASAFLMAINHNLFSGIFMLPGQTKEKATQITPTGRITNFKDFDRFEVCLTGDCFVLGPGDHSDIITLYNKKDEANKKMYNFRYSGQNDTLYMYNLINERPEEKGAYKLGKLAYTFLRKKPD
jgi:hypothetical protein